MVGGDDVRVGTHAQLGNVDPASDKCVELLKEHRNIDDDAVGDDGHNALRENARWQKVQRVLLGADDNGVAGIVAAVEFDDIIDAVTEQVGSLALSFIAPLGADQNDGGHGKHPFRLVGDYTPV